MKTIEASPHASLLIESMRDVGYSLETALADIIDNSITAGALSIKLFVDTNALRIGVLDNGRGMTEAELIEAMRPGTRSPLEERDTSDLGRFGLGLKTASFSQCRKLTVVARHDGSTSAAQWDLDLVARTNRWLVVVPENVEHIPWVRELGDEGTLVIWENLDRALVPGDSAGGAKDFVRRVNEAREHLELVFHRYLSGEPGLRRVSILLNGRPLEPFDPFNSNHSATIRGPSETIRLGDQQVKIQAFTLPHHNKLTSADWLRYGGSAGYVKNQGFYVYREKRLIIHGTWFGLARQTELTKLTRVRIDITNKQDAEWKVDVKKAWVQPPYQVRERLRRIVEAMGATSKRIYTSRGKKLVEENRLPMWNRVQVKDEIVYQLNPDHPVFVDFRSRIPDALRPDFMRVIELAASSLPLDALFADMGGNPDKVSGTAATDDMLRHALVTTYRQLILAGVTDRDIRIMVQAAEPFRSNWMRTEAILDTMSKGDETLD